MKKHIYTIIAFAVFAASALAYDGPGMDVKVPFAFQAGASVLPAGTYKITKAAFGIFLLRGEKEAVFVPQSAVLVDIDNSGKFIFRFALAGARNVLPAAHPGK